MKKSLMAAAALAAVAGLPSAAWADEGMVVVRDARTGALRAPTAAEAAALRGKHAEGAERQAAPTVTRLPHGGVKATVPASLMTYSVVQRREDGSLQRECVQGEEQANAALLPAFAERIKTTASAARTLRGMPYEDQ